MADNDIDAAILREFLRYDPETGVFTWLKNTGKMHYAGRQAGGLNVLRYMQIGFFGRRRLAHRLAWLWMTGAHASRDIDHIDGNPSNNAWANLRLATSSQNHGNMKKHKDNTSGFKGVSWEASKKKWAAQIYVEGRRLFLGRYDAPEKAHEVYCAAAKKQFGEFARAG